MRLREFEKSNRGLAFRIVLFGLIWIIGGMLWALLDPLMADLFTQYGAYTTSSQAATGQGYVETAWEYAPFIIAIIGILSLMAGALIERRSGVRV